MKLNIIQAFIALLFLLFSNYSFAQPSNDACSSAIPITVGSSCTTGTNTDATDDGTDPTGCANIGGFGEGSLGGNTVWYSFQAEFTETNISLSVESGISLTPFDPVIAIYESCTGSSIACGNSGGGGDAESVVVSTVPGNTYLIMVDGSDGLTTSPTGDFCISVSNFDPPANNDCANAINLTVDAPCVNGTNVSANNNDQAPGCSPSQPFAEHSVWYKFTATDDWSSVETDYVSGDLDLIIEVLDGCSGNTIKCINANPYQGNEGVLVPTTPGDEYYVRVDGSNGGGIFGIGGSSYPEGEFCIRVNAVDMPPQPDGACANALPFCTGETYYFPAAQNTDIQPADAGYEYACLNTQPNPAWYYLKIQDPGDITIYMSSDAGEDIDFIAWGPFSDLDNICNEIPSDGLPGPFPNNTVGTTDPDPHPDYPSAQVTDCSYDTRAFEYVHILNAQPDEYYMLCILNFSNAEHNITFSQSNYDPNGTPGADFGTTDCTIMNPANCTFTNLTATPGTCDPADNTYDVTGTIEFEDAPTTGTMTVSIDGEEQVFNAPFTSPQNYTITDLLSDGSQHTVNVVFSDDNCDRNQVYNAPAGCGTLSCAINGTNNTVCGGDPCNYDGPTILINEVMLSPNPNDGSIYGGTTPSTQQGEWIELYNPDLCNPIDISCYILGNYTEDQGTFLTEEYGGGFIIPAGTVVPPGGFAVIRGQNATPVDPNLLVMNGGNTVEVIVDNNVCTDGGSRLWFPNSGGWFAFYNELGEPQDAIYWGSPAANITAGNPCNPGVSGCYSGTIPSFDDIDPGLISHIGTTDPSLNQNNTLRRIPDGGVWQTDNFSTPTQGDCNDDCIPPFQATCDGTATITVTAGSGNYEYTWSNGNVTQTITNLCAGDYSVTVTDLDFGQTCEQTITITEPPMPDSEFTLDSPICLGHSSDAEAVNSYPSGEYHWDLGTGSFAQDTEGPHSITPGSTGTIDVKLYIIDSGCTSDTTIHQIEVNQAPAPTLTSNSPICEGETLTLECSAASTYQWTGPSGYVYSGQTVTVTNAAVSAGGTYTITITDLSGCQSTGSIDVVVNPLPNITVSSNSPICEGEDLTLQASGGDAYSWTGPNSFASTEQNPTISAATPAATGTYSVEAESTEGCTSIEPINIVVNALPVINVSSNSPICEGETLNLSTSNIGSYSWTGPNGFASTVQYPVINNAEVAHSGNYTLVVTSLQSCSSTEIISVSVNQNPVVSLDKTDLDCYNDASGTVTSEVVGGSSPYTYQWSAGGVSDSSIAGLQTGTYAVTVYDANNCSGTANIEVFEPDELTAIFSDIQNPLCFSDCNGQATVDPDGGTTPYTYNWVSTETSQSASQLCSGSNQVTVTDANGCEILENVTLNDPAPVVITNESSTDVICYGQGNGTISVTASGGTGTLTYSKGGFGQATGNFTELTPNTYVITVTDENGCSAVSSDLIINQPDELEVSINTSEVSCNNGNDGSAWANATGGNGGYVYNWSNGQAGDSIVGVSPGHIIVNVTDTKGCPAEAETDIDNPTPVSLTTPSNYVICLGDEVIITTQTNGGTPPYHYELDGSPASPPFIVTPQYADTMIYDVIAYDENNCPSNLAQSFVLVHPPVEASLILSKDSICPGEPVTVTPEVSGGDGPPYWYYDTDGNLLSPPHIYYPENSQDITFVVKDNLCGSKEVSEYVHVYEFPPIVMQSDITSGCVPLMVSFTEASSNQDLVYEWRFGDNSGITSSARQPIHTYQNPGYYDVSLSILTPEGCVQDETIDNMIIVHPSPISRFSYSPDAGNVITHPQIDFANSSVDNYFNIWSFGDGDSSSVVNPSHVFRQAGKYTVTLVTESEYGCLDTTKQTVVIKDEYTFYTPDAINPYLGNENSIFRPFGHGIDTETTYRMIIYDRWGEEIFISDDWFIGWDGKVKGGAVAELGVYCWMITFVDILGNPHTESGTVTVIK